MTSNVIPFPIPIPKFPPSRAATMEAEWPLIVAAKAGDRAAFDVLVQPLRGRAIAAARSQTQRDRELAEDAAQEALLIAWLKLAAYEHRAPFAAWLCSIAVNCARSMQRSRSHYVLLENRDDDGEGGDHPQDALRDARATTFVGEQQLGVHREMQGRVREVMELPDLERQVHVHLRWLGKSAEQVAREMDLPLRRVESLRRSALRRLALGAEPLPKRREKRLSLPALRASMREIVHAEDSP